MPTTLKLSFTESRYITSSELAEYFFRRSNARVELLKKDQIMPRSYFWELSVNVTRTDQKNSLAIGIITNAKNELILRRATDSALRVLGRMPETEILVCGPSDLILKHLKDRDQIKIIDYQDVGLNESRITTKKNLIVSNSNAGYILLIHDRYEILDALPSALESFGFSFDVAVPGQITTGGKEFPGLAAKTRLNGRSKSLRIPVGHFHKNWYVNGGAILAKRDVLVERASLLE
jgi:hypothetical protein